MITNNDYYPDGPEPPEEPEKDPRLKTFWGCIRIILYAALSFTAIIIGMLQ